VEYALDSNFQVISPGLLTVKEGMPNRILLMGDRALNRDDVKNALLREWGKILDRCRLWVEHRLERDYDWSQKEDDRNIQKGEWERWKSYAWEVFWGYGTTVKDAMEDLETRKLKRDWTAINWVGESSSLSGTDAIVWHGLGQKSDRPWEWSCHKEAVDQFYQDLAQALETESTEDNLLGKFLSPSERLSIPELVKRLVTRYEDIGQHLGKEFYFDSLSEMVRMPEPGQHGHWTGWFMGDGDSVGNKLKDLANDSNNIQALKDWILNKKGQRKPWRQESGKRLRIVTP
jgi:CRISPR-associated protein Cmr2